MFKDETKTGEDFTDAPSLAEAASGGMGIVPVMDFANTTEHASRGFLYEGRENGSDRFRILMHPEMRSHERAK